MPETKKERLIFLVMMSAAMTAGMESYNLILMRASGAHLIQAIAIDFPLMMLTVMLTQTFIAGPAAMRLAQCFLPETPSPVRRMVTVSTCTVLLMCPLMSLAATLYFKRGLGYIPSVWLATFLFNLPMAYCWQMLVAGPLVRKSFRVCFR